MRDQQQRIVCLHEKLAEGDSYCPDCGTYRSDILLWPYQFVTARAWAGLAMWCMCGGRFDE